MASLEEETKQVQEGDEEVAAEPTPDVEGGTVEPVDTPNVPDSQPPSQGNPPSDDNSEIQENPENNKKRERRLFAALGTVVVGWAATTPLYFDDPRPGITMINATFGAEEIKSPVILRLTGKEFEEKSPVPFYERMFISGVQAPEVEFPDIEWHNQSGFWYLRVFPKGVSTRDCPIPGKILSPSKVDNEDNPANVTTCHLYDFRLVIYNNLTEGATVHFHGLAPPSNQDGVPFVANANIHPEDLQYYRFHQYTYPGMHWMHAHTGFQQAYGVSAPIILEHGKTHADANRFNLADDLVVMLEEGFVYPLCAYSAKSWYETECNNLNASLHGKLAFYINRQEDVVEHKMKTNAEFTRVRFLNAGSEAPWRITDRFSTEYGGAPANMEIMATDGQDVIRNVTRNEFVLGLANRIDVLLKVNPDFDTVITAIQMMHRGNVTNPVLRHVIIRGPNATERISADQLPKNDADNSTILENFDLIASLKAVHPLRAPESDLTTRDFTVFNRGGDQNGGFPLSIYEGIKTTVREDDVASIKNLYPVQNYTELNHLKFQLPPYKVFRHQKTENIISTRRSCAGCANTTTSGIRRRHKPNSTYTIDYTAREDVLWTKDTSNEFCCWEWCDVPEDECGNYTLTDVFDYKPNEKYIPVCYGDRVRILFINAVSFEELEGHPMHLHGHDFALRELYDIDESGQLKLNKTYEWNGPKMDTIWVPYNRAVLIEFDAFNPGEHLLHCHNDFHLENGMVTTVRYINDDEMCKDFPAGGAFVGGLNSYPTQLCDMPGCDDLTLP